MTPDSDLRPAYGLLIFGFVSLLIGVIATFTGEAWGRFGRVTYRTKQPTEFWWEVVLSYLIGIGFIGYFFYKVYGFPY